MKKLRVPYIRQTADYTCGPVVLQMIFAFFGITKSLKSIMRIAGTTKADGTPANGLTKAIRTVGLTYKRTARARWTDIRSFLDEGVPVVVHYREPSADEGHYSIITGYEDGKVIFNDPVHGRGFVMKRSEFLKRWIGYVNVPKDRGWMIVVREPGKRK